MPGASSKKKKKKKKNLYFGFLRFKVGIIKPDLPSRAVVKIKAEHTDTWKHTL